MMKKEEKQFVLWAILLTIRSAALDGNTRLESSYIQKYIALFDKLNLQYHKKDITTQKVFINYKYDELQNFKH